MNEWETCIVEWADRCKELSDENKRLSEHLAALAPAWSQEAPTVPGWYWRRTNVDVRVEEIVSGHLGVYSRRGDKIYYGDQLHGSWAGPIVPPEGTR